MDAQNLNGTGNVFTLISFIGVMFAWISVKDVQTIFAIVASGVAIVAGLLSWRYNYLAIKREKKNLAKQERENKTE